MNTIIHLSFIFQVWYNADAAVSLPSSLFTGQISTHHPHLHLLRSQLSSASRTPEILNHVIRFDQNAVVHISVKTKSFTKHWSKVQGEAESHSQIQTTPPHSTPNTHIHNQTCTHAHKHPRLADRDGRDDSDLLIYESFYSVKPPQKMMWVQMDGEPDPGRLVAQTKCLWWRKRRIEEKWKSFQRVLVELQLLACWWVSQNSELLSWEKPATLLDPHS